MNDIPSSLRRVRPVLAVLLAGTALWGQDFRPSTVELDLGLGAGLFHKRPDPLRTKFTNGGLGAIRLTENIWNHWSLEQSLGINRFANVRFNRLIGSDALNSSFDQANYSFMFNPVYHLTERGSRVRPFLTLGAGLMRYVPTDEGRADALRLGPAVLQSSTKAAMNYGGGIKARITDLIGLRFDLRGIWSGNPRLGLPESGTAPNLFIPKGGSLHGLQTTGGISFNFGGAAATGGAASTASAREFRLSPIKRSFTGDINVGDTDRLTVDLTDSAKSPNVDYDWFVNGKRVSGVDGPEFNFKPEKPGTYKIEAVAKDGSLKSSSGPIEITVRESGAQSQPVAPPKPAEPPKPAREFRLDPLTRSGGDLWVGDSETIRAKLTDTANSPTTVYEWTVNGQPVAGATGPEFRFNAERPGTYTIGVTAKDGDLKAETNTVTINVKEIPPLTITSAVDRNEIKAGETANLTAQATQSDYSGRLTYRWEVSEGTVTGGGATSAGRYDSSSVAFDPAQQFKPQTKTVTAIASVTDERGRSARAQPLTIRIVRNPVAVRLDDVIFPVRSSRVNNCGKRILLDELAAIVNNNPEVEAVLIGHRDEKEPARAGLDRERALNVAAILSAGKGICANCDLDRIKVDWVGADQSAEHRGGFCGTSTRQKTDERKSAEISADDEAAKNRRVEIWIVPKGVAMPASAKNPRPAPVKAVKAKGCPR